MRVLVLVGGNSAERDVSLATGEAVIKALRESGHDVLSIDTARGRELLDTARPLLPQGISPLPPTVESGLSTHTPDEVITALRLPETKAIDIVFLALHGGDGEDGHLQALLDLAGVHYTGSGQTASVLAMNKHLAKLIFSAREIPTPAWIFLESAKTTRPEFAEVVTQLGQPFIVKPNEQGSTVGFSIVETETDYFPAVDSAFNHDRAVLLEQYIPGREVTIAILGDRALPVIEIVPEHGVYDYECKYTAGKSQYICPAELSPALTRQAQSISLQAFNAIGCFGYGRVDFRLNNQGELYCLEINTLPGMTATSLVPKAAAAVDIGFAELIETICQLAINGQCGPGD